MTGMSALAIETLFPAYDFSDRRLIVDVGGGHGALIAAVLEHAPETRGVLFDLPDLVVDAGPNLEAAGVTARCAVSGGSFFESVPNGGDAYLLKTIIHDWDDDDALTILRNIRTAAQYADLLSRAGFRQTRVIATAGPASVVEAVPV